MNLPFKRKRIKNTQKTRITLYIRFVIQLSLRYLRKFIVNIKWKNFIVYIVLNIGLLNGDPSTILTGKFSNSTSLCVTKWSTIKYLFICYWQFFSQMWIVFWPFVNVVLQRITWFKKFPICSHLSGWLWLNQAYTKRKKN